MAARKTTAPVVAEEYTEDDNWDGQVEGQEVDGAEPKKRGRQVSPRVVAMRAYDKAHKAAEKARAAVAKYQPLIDSLAELEKEEAAARDAVFSALDDSGD